MCVCGRCGGVGDERHRGRRPHRFAWPYDTETLVKRGVEIQTWIVELDDQGPQHRQQTDVWWETLIGVTDQLELSIPMIFRWERTDTPPTVFTFDRYGLEARYRFVESDPDPETAPAFVPLVRAAVYREIGDRTATGFEGDLVLSYTAGDFHAVIDARAAAIVRNAANVFVAAPSAGVSYKAVGDLRLGVEAYAQIALRGTHDEDFYIAGPDLAWTHGRFWITATAGIGLKGIHAAPRVIWGVLF
jgi:hypothetical protein